MRKIEKIFLSKIFIFDFSFICVLLGFILYISFQNIFSSSDLKRIEKDTFVYKKITYPIDIKQIKKSYVILEKKFRSFFNFVEERKDLIRYLPLKTLIYVPKKIKESKLPKEEKKKEKKLKKKIRKILRKKIKLFTYLRSIVYNFQNPKLSFIYISVSDNRHALKREKYYLKENTCIYIERKKLNFCIDKIKPDYVKAKIFTDNGDKIWTINLYLGKRPIYLEY